MVSPSTVTWRAAARRRRVGSRKGEVWRRCRRCGQGHQAPSWAGTHGADLVAVVVLGAGMGTVQRHRWPQPTKATGRTSCERGALLPPSTRRFCVSRKGMVVCAVLFARNNRVSPLSIGKSSGLFCASAIFGPFHVKTELWSRPRVSTQARAGIVVAFLPAVVATSTRSSSIGQRGSAIARADVPAAPMRQLFIYRVSRALHRYIDVPEMSLVLRRRELNQL